MKNTYTIEIDAPPADVFYFLEDGERLKDWLPNLVEHEDLTITRRTRLARPPAKSSWKEADGWR